MVINVSKNLKTLTGETLKDSDGQGNAIDATLRMACVNALLAPLGQGKSESGMDKVKKYELAKRIYAADEVELSAEDISLIKERVGTVYPAMIVGQVFEMLEGKDN